MLAVFLSGALFYWSLHALLGSEKEPSEVYSHLYGFRFGLFALMQDERFGMGL